MPKVYTSRYSNLELAAGNYTVVGVTRGAPKFPLRYQLSGNIMDIAPPGYLFNEYDRGRFTAAYFRHMDKIGVGTVHRLISRYLNLGKDVVLCCYEDVRKPNEWCHRLVFAEWWLKRTGEVIVELQDPSTVKVPHEAKPNEPPKATQEEQGPEQFKLW